MLATFRSLSVNGTFKKSPNGPLQPAQLDTYAKLSKLRVSAHLPE